MAGENDKWEMYEDKRGEHRWRRRASNGNIVGASCEGYTKKADCKKNAQRHGMDGNPDALGEINGKSIKTSAANFAGDVKPQMVKSRGRLQKAIKLKKMRQPMPNETACNSPL